MKKVFLFISIIAICFTSHAQTVLMKSFTKLATVDTVGNSVTDTMFVKVSGIWSNISIQATWTNVGTKTDSATVHTYFYGSIDGVNFVQIGSTGYRSDSTKTVSQGTLAIVGDKYLYYATLTTAHGSDSVQVKCTLTYKSTPFAPNVTGGYAKLSSSNWIGGHNKDSIKNTGVDTMTLQVSNPHFNVSIQPVIKKVSGTLGGVAQLQVSEDGTNFKNVAGDSLHLTDVSTVITTIWTVPASTEQHQYYRVLTTGRSTPVATVKNYLIGK